MANYELTRQIEGTFSEPEMVRLNGIVSKVPDDGIVVEIGCLYGRSSSVIYYAKKPNVQFFTVDIFVGTSRWPADKQYEKLINNMSKFEFYPKIIHGNSEMASSHFEDQSIDLLFIDANHEEEFVTTDIKTFLPKMKKGSTISGHDWGFPSVQAALKSCFPNSDIKLQQGTSIWEIIIE